MTVKITKPALNLREELASLRNQGSAYEESKFYIGNLVTNGTFDSDVSGWTTNSKGTFVSSGGVAVLTNTQVGDRLRVYYEFTTVVGKSYTISFTSVTTGLFLHVGNTSGGAEYAANLGVSAGNHSLTFVATTTLGSIQVGTYSDANGATGSIDNISVYETDGTDTIHSTPYGYEVKDVYIDGDLAREGEAYDYTVHDGYIKPTIEPTASTETCLIGVRK